MNTLPSGLWPRTASVSLVACWLLVSATPAHASIFEGETLDSIANAISWVAIVIAPIIGIVVFWLVHILPEKIAHKKKHPQTRAIQCLCLLSLVFGGLLWPIAWLWAYSKPVLHKLAYGTDVDETLGHHDAEAAASPSAEAEVHRLRDQITALQAKLASTEAQPAAKVTKGGRG